MGCDTYQQGAGWEHVLGQVEGPSGPLVQEELATPRSAIH